MHCIVNAIYYMAGCDPQTIDCKQWRQTIMGLLRHWEDPSTLPSQRLTPGDIDKCYNAHSACLQQLSTISEALSFVINCLEEDKDRQLTKLRDQVEMYKVKVTEVENLQSQWKELRTFMSRFPNQATMQNPDPFRDMGDVLDMAFAEGREHLARLKSSDVLERLKQGKEEIDTRCQSIKEGLAEVDRHISTIAQSLRGLSSKYNA